MSDASNDPAARLNATIRNTAVLLALFVPVGASAQAGADPAAGALRVLDRLESDAPAWEAAAQAVLPCEPENVVGSRVLDGLLERRWSEGARPNAARALGGIPWEACPDPRIDRWLSIGFLTSLGVRFRSMDGTGTEYVTFWQAVSDRRAPDRERVWRIVAEDLNLPDSIRTRAIEELLGL